ncbi:MAG: UDP-N-acetylglucosamine--N-acetylmuramyl-(pentapeptide) pyrophosphoryl-undecaprenol N-acetylglucosamine transferase [Clostridia bacterium]|nr:UDP-N-acetylglucosamine--N-acetylmuramyl-(pentapeptide) pyrophosphoryl-undecaprenol N-acetylglucosamine transferase [Clostridia bacterium]
MPTIILTGGGSAGHCTPHLAILPYLKKYFDKIYYVGSKNGIEKTIISNAKLPYFEIDCAKLNRSFTLKNLTIPFKVLKGIKEAEKIIDEISPDVIFSKGGYVSIPIVIAAKKRKIPVISHESDITAGLANKIISRYSKKVLTSFDVTAKEFKNGKYIGSPIRNLSPDINKSSIIVKYGLSGKKPVLLITGGSLGATAINTAVDSAVDSLLKTFDIIHIRGRGNLNSKLKMKGYYQTEFVNDINNVFSVTDVCISRAGSNTVFELLSLKIPCLLIPLPKGTSRGDQVLNAEYFFKKGLCSVLPQNLLTGQSLLTNVLCLYNGRKSLQKNLELFPIQNMSPYIANELICAAKHNQPLRRDTR